MDNSIILFFALLYNQAKKLCMNFIPHAHFLTLKANEHGCIFENEYFVDSIAFPYDNFRVKMIIALSRLQTYNLNVYTRTK